MSLRVLVVEDNRALRSLLAQILEVHGFAPVEAECAEDALHVATNDPPDLVIVDQHLPSLNGADLIRLLRAATPGLRDTPILGLSGRRGSEQQLLSAGASCFVPKPFHEAGLLDAIRSVGLDPVP